MPVPAEVEIGPFTYTVTLDPAAIDAEEERQDATLYGFIDPFELVIGIEFSQADDQKRDSLLHECLHGLCSLTGLDIEMKPEAVEPLVRRLSPVLLDLLRDNPDLVAFLTEPANGMR